MMHNAACGQHTAEDEDIYPAAFDLFEQNQALIHDLIQVKAIDSLNYIPKYTTEV